MEVKMGILSDLTLEDLRNATLVQIQTAIKNKLAGLSKKQLIILILRVADIDVENFEIQDKEEGEDGPNGQVWRIRTIRDVLGQIVRKERFDWTYHPGIEGKRPVHLITKTQLDADGKAIGETEVIAKH
jgi:hypothetical protein